MGGERQPDRALSRDPDAARSHAPEIVTRAETESHPGAPVSILLIHS